MAEKHKSQLYAVLYMCNVYLLVQLVVCRQRNKNKRKKKKKTLKQNKKNYLITRFSWFFPPHTHDYIKQFSLALNLQKKKQENVFTYLGKTKT